MIIIKSIRIGVIISLFFTVLLAERSDADIYFSTNIYFASGVIVIGGVSVYLFLSSGHTGLHTKNIMPPKNNIIKSFYSAEVDLYRSSSNKNSFYNNGLIKLYEW